MSNTYFRFRIKFASERNLRGSADRLHEALWNWFAERGIQPAIGDHFGCSYIRYGQVGPEPRGVTEEDRQSFVQWVRNQPFCGTVRLENLVEYDPAADMFAPITDWVFEVNSLNAEQQAEASAYHAELRQRKEDFLKVQRDRRGN